MQRCQYCGTELPEGARICGNCGRVPAPAGQPGVPMAQGAPQAGSTPSGPSSPYPGSPQAFSQQPQVRGQFSQAGPQAFAQGPQNSQFRQSQFQSQNPVPGQGQAPAQFQSSQPQQMQRPGMPGNPPQFPQQQQATPKGSSGGIPRWLVITIIGVIVVAIGGGAFALLHNSLGTGGSPSTESGSTSFTPVASCLQNPSRSATLTFSGDVSGSMVVNQFMACGPLAYQGKQAYSGNATGTIGGTNYNFLFVALNYNGPGTYTFPKVAATLAIPGNASKTWAIDPTASSTITINSDGKSGTLNLHLFNPANITSKVSVTGNWSS